MCLCDLEECLRLVLESGVCARDIQVGEQLGICRSCWCQLASSCVCSVSLLLRGVCSFLSTLFYQSPGNMAIPFFFWCCVKLVSTYSCSNIVIVMVISSDLCFSVVQLVFALSSIYCLILSTWMASLFLYLPAKLRVVVVVLVLVSKSVRCSFKLVEIFHFR